MKARLESILAHVRSEEGRKKLRYAGVSVVFVPLGQAGVLLFGALFNSYVAGSLMSAAILTLPNFFANKRFVWRVMSKDNQRTQILVFWVAAMLGVTFATGLTWIVEQLTADQTGLFKKACVIAAQLTGFGIVWVARFLILDRWLFKVTHGGTEPDPDDIDGMRGEVPI